MKKMPKLIITGEKTKSKELPNSFHDPDMSEEEYEKRKPTIKTVKNTIFNLKMVIQDYMGIMDKDLVPEKIKEKVKGVCKHIEDVIKECGYVIALYQRDYSNWSDEDHEYVHSVGEKVKKILDYYEKHKESGLKLWMGLELENTASIKIKF
jgi:gas vesicle protein